MAAELKVLDNTSDVSVYLTEGDEKKRQAVLCHLGGGVLRFAQAIFPGTSTEKIYGQLNERESEGRGPHFDVYGKVCDEHYPHIGVLNLSGTVAVKTVILPPDLAEAYFRIYPEPTDDAFNARRHFAAIVLGQPNAEIQEGTMGPGTGLLIPQPISGPHIVHEVVPVDSRDPGEFIKLVVPSGDVMSINKMEAGGYKPIDELLTGFVQKAEQSKRVERVSFNPPERKARPYNFDDEEDFMPSRRNCNLD